MMMMVVAVVANSVMMMIYVVFMIHVHVYLYDEVVALSRYRYNPLPRGSDINNTRNVILKKVAISLGHTVTILVHRVLNIE